VTGSSAAAQDSSAAAAGDLAGRLGIGKFADGLPGVGRFVSLGEGGTPVVPLPRLAAQLGVAALWAKLESLNPTGSYKDRVAAMSLSLAVDRGMAGWIATSSGNAGLAMAAFGARAGLPGFLCLVATTPPEKRAPIVPYGVSIVTVSGVGRQATASGETDLFRHVSTAAERHGLFLGITAHAFNPDGMRGVDTLGYELASQMPDATHVYVPAGGGGLLTATARGLRHRQISARVVAAQPSGCAPIARYLQGEIPQPRIAACESSISALQLPNPPDGQLAAEAVAASGGWGTHVSDQQILQAQHRLAVTEGLSVEPASAAALAAAIEDAHRRRIGSGDSVVLIVTGAGWKDLSRFTTHGRDLPLVSAAEVPAAVDDWIRARRENSADMGAG
jgi:threonine synthase